MDCQASIAESHNALTGMFLARLRHKDKWYNFATAMQDGLFMRKPASE
ncbi:hypothetical protein NTGM5_630023 [Candidatus Nitrotoga sp. M5]|nr:hypothetical protein NTGM5_630023 [Candidatus Nitrotoga sp. M5]